MGTEVQVVGACRDKTEELVPAAKRQSSTYAPPFLSGSSSSSMNLIGAANHKLSAKGKEEHGGNEAGNAVRSKRKQWRQQTRIVGFYSHAYAHTCYVPE